jgi:site-specific recombinase XerD
MIKEKTYLVHTKFNTYKFNRRVPKMLLKYSNGIKSFRVSLGADKEAAIVSAIQFNSVIDEALKLVSLRVSDEIVEQKLSVLFPKDKHKVPNKEGLFSDVVISYLKSNASNVSEDEIKAKHDFYHDICPNVFKHIKVGTNPILKDIAYDDLLKFKNIICNLPKRNIQKYRSMEVGSILNILDDVPPNDKLSARTVNKYIKWLRALFNFALIRGLVNVNLATALPIIKTLDDKLQRLPLSIDEIITLKANVEADKSYLIDVLFLTGMRLSEMYKCKVVTIDGVRCFDLTDRSIKLKTKASYRTIPVHSSLLNEIDKFEAYRYKISSSNLSSSLSNQIKKLNFKDSHKKSLYSLRHSFASELIKLGANNTHVSQLMGHSLAQSGGMTLTRYASGFSIKQLQDTLELIKC